MGSQETSNSFTHNSWVIGFDIRTEGMGNIINTNTGYLNLNFNFDVPRQERASKYGEDRYEAFKESICIIVGTHERFEDSNAGYHKSLICNPIAKG